MSPVSQPLQLVFLLVVICQLTEGPTAQPVMLTRLRVISQPGDSKWHVCPDTAPRALELRTGSSSDVN